MDKKRRYKAEYSANRTSICKKCKIGIEKQALRLVHLPKVIVPFCKYDFEILFEWKIDLKQNANDLFDFEL